MIRLKSLEFEAFRGFAGKNRIDFPETGVVLIQGAIAETPGEASGSGKTTVFWAIAYALGFCPESQSSLQSWHTDKEPQVALTVAGPDGDYVVRRGKKNSIECPDGTAINGAKAIGEFVPKLFGVNLETLQALTYRQQRAPGFFLSLTDSEKKEFLTKILGLEAIEKAIEKTDAEIKRLEAAVATKETAVAGSKKLVEVTRGVLERSAFELRDTGAEKQEVTSLRVAVQEARCRWDAAKAAVSVIDASTHADILHLRVLLKATEDKLVELQTADAARHKGFMAESQAARQELQTLAKADAIRAGIIKQIADLRTKLEHAEAGRCSQCERPWEHSVAKVQEYRQATGDLEIKLVEVADKPDRRRELEARVAVAFTPDENVARAQQLVATLRASIQERTAAIEAENRANEKQALAAIGAEIQVLEANLHTATAKLQSLEQAQATAKKQLDFAARDLQVAERALTTDAEALEALKSAIGAERDFLALMGREGFLGLIFEEVLSEIQTEVNACLGRMANVSHVTLSFRTETLTQKGTTKRAIVPMVMVGGHEAPIKSGLSGGMLTSVEGAVDWALMTVVQRRTGAMPGFLLLDEAFIGQGTATMESVMEILSEYGGQKLVLVIDHNNKFKEMFSKVITIRQSGGISEVVNEG